MTEPPAVPQPTWSNLVPPPGVRPLYQYLAEISPDGRKVAFVADAPEGKQMLWVRDLTTEAARPLAGTAGAWMPFWSPDSRAIAYFANRGLRRVDIGGGVPTLIGAASDEPRGGCWGPDGTILFVPGWNHPVHRIPAEGGTAEPVTALRPELLELSHRWPQFLPDGRHFLYYAVSTYPELNPDNPAEVDKSGLYLASFDGAEPRLLQTARSRARYVDGSLLYVDDHVLMARPFDPGSLEFAGPAAPVVEGVTQNVDGMWGGGLFSVSGEGTLLFVRGASERNPLVRLTWRDRQGGLLGTVGEPSAYGTVRLSHDGRRVATEIEDPADVWIFDLERGTSTRFTFDTGNDADPQWSPDDSRIVFQSSRVVRGQPFSPARLFTRPTSGLEPETELATSGPLATPADWSPDGRYILLSGFAAGQGDNILRFSIEEAKFETLIGTEHDESAPRLSPDGRWMAYKSNESGRDEVYVQSFPATGGKWQVSLQGGSAPVWRGDGRELYYLDPESALMAVPVQAGAGWQTGPPVRLFMSAARSLRSAAIGYDAAPDGRRFLIMEPAEESGDTSAIIGLVRDWTPPGKRR